jgi:cytochrome c5
LSLLTFVTSCVTPKGSFQTGGKITAVRQIFPSAVDITEISQDVRISGRPDDAKISEIKDDSGLLGYCVESKVVSRSGPFKIRVLLDKQLYVKQAAVISYPWDRGRDVCKRTFTSQFEGKGPEDPIQLGKDIDAMTGATISCRVMAEGVRDTIKHLKLVKEKQLEEQNGKSTRQKQQHQYAEEQFKQQTNEPKIVKTIHNKEMNGGEVLYRKNCSSCHDLIEPGRFDREKWNTYAKKYGKKMTDEEKRVVLEYLGDSD